MCIIDGMAEVQTLDKPGTIKYCSDLADHFVVHLFEKYSEHDELRLIFDRYNTRLKNSLIIALFAFLFKLFVCLKEIFETRLYYLVLDTMSRYLLNLQFV